MGLKFFIFKEQLLLKRKKQLYRDLMCFWQSPLKGSYQQPKSSQTRVLATSFIPYGWHIGSYRCLYDRLKHQPKCNLLVFVYRNNMNSTKKCFARCHSGLSVGLLFVGATVLSNINFLLFIGWDVVNPMCVLTQLTQRVVQFL